MKSASRLGRWIGALAFCTLYAAPAQADDVVSVAAKAGSFKTLVAAVKAAGLTDALKGDGPFTVFAPTDAAFAKLPPDTLATLLLPENRKLLTRILTYHVLPNEVLAANVKRLKSGAKVGTLNGAKLTIRNRDGLKADNANIVQTDVLAENGVIHVIDTVLMPPMDEATPRRETRPARHEARAQDDLVDVAAKAGDFQTLVTAVKAAGLVETLKGDGPFTVFAPTDEAFAKIPKETLRSLLRPENRRKLAAILTYHVVPGRVLAADVARLRNGSRVATVNGGRVAIRNRHGLKVEEANIVKTDILARNGVIHVIDAVLMPPMDAEEEGDCAGK